MVLITLDGLRWQELFRGADTAFMKQEKNLKDPLGLKTRFWEEDQTERREKLMPFFWNTIAEKGQLYGNRDFNNKVNVTNRQWFSYPGYNEILTGKADDERVNSNEKKYNPNINVLEFIHQQPGYSGKVAAFSSWDCFPYIINDQRNKIPVNSGVVKVKGDPLTENEQLLNNLLESVPNPLGDVRLDAFTFYYAFEYLKKNKPRLLYIAFDETDDFAHQGEYGAYLNAAHYTDRFLNELWFYLQSDPVYQDKTTLIITTDHGRGVNSEDWKHHGIRIEHADEIWIAIMGPDTPASGEMMSDNQYYQNQLAKTMAAFLGFDFDGEGRTGNLILEAFTR